MKKAFLLAFIFNIVMKIGVEITKTTKKEKIEALFGWGLFTIVVILATKSMFN
ncbi:hypothetical protein QMO72_06275 [Staphylococcus casei]|uniref:hypothetical protein n=1 Tax=Staphylococcus TaxID=1279 RepID=UPI001304C47A|nr:hypothetical protein [Staphylococcus casei]WJE87545.1 hypothetical protein QMO72_06275 [Staphylococcus casei]